MKRFVLSFTEEKLLDRLLTEYAEARRARTSARKGITQALEDRRAAIDAGVYPAEPPPVPLWLADLKEAVEKEHLAVARETIRLTSELVHILRRI